MLQPILIGIGLLDAALLVGVGCITAVATIFGWWDAQQRDAIWDRMWPATGILVSSSLAAGVILIAVTWAAGFFA